MTAVRLETRDLTLAVAGRTLCRSLNATLAAGENWVILGANGSGKTTLLLTLAGLRAPDGGEVLLDGRPIRTYAARERARRIGVLFQDPETVFPATVLETVLTGRHPHLERWRWEGPEDAELARQALAAMELDGFAGRTLTTLSGGERRRVDIAALLTQDAPVNLLDEPTNHLDLRHQVSILAGLAVRARLDGRLNVFVLHDVNLALRFAGHGILLFGDGEARHGRLTEIVDRETLERVYRCRLRERRDGQEVFYFPA